MMEIDSGPSSPKGKEKITMMDIDEIKSNMPW